MRRVPDVYKRVARMSGEELFAQLDQPTWAPGPGPPRLTIRTLVMAEIEERLIHERPRVGKRKR